MKLNSQCPYTVSAVSGMYSEAISIEVIFPRIGKSKPEKVKAIANTAETVTDIVKKIEREYTISLIKRFYESQTQRFTGHQTEWRLEALGVVKDNSKRLKDGMDWLHVIAVSIGPKMKELATKKTESRFYKYDNDVVDFLRAIVMYHKNKASN
jgi:hypothetical protein